MVLARRAGTAASWTELSALISLAGVEVIAHDLLLTATARDAFLRYGKGRHPAGLHLGDCASYALAKVRALPLLCKGDDFPATDVMLAN